MFDVKAIRNDFPMFQNNKEFIYLDSSATSFKPQVVIDAVNDYYLNHSVNVHRGDYKLSYDTSVLYDGTKDVVARFINAKNAEEIIYTSGATASLNLVAFGYALNNLKKDDIILLTEAEHASNVLPWFEVAKRKGAIIRYIPLDQDGYITEENLLKVLDEKVKICTFAEISNVMGKIQNTKMIASLVHKVGGVVAVDGAQSVPHKPTDVIDSDIDFLSFSSHKMLGPSGVGIFYGKYDLLKKMTPLYYGGDSNALFYRDGRFALKDIPTRFESGTPNIEGVLGLRAAIDYLSHIGMENIENYEKELTAYLHEKAKELDNIEVYNPNSDIGIFAFNVNGVFAQDVGGYLASCNIAVRSGTHCAKILPDVIKASETVRASLYFYNTKEEIDYLFEVLKDCDLDKCLGAIL